jgi:hypothetical protein
MAEHLIDDDDSREFLRKRMIHVGLLLHALAISDVMRPYKAWQGALKIAAHVLRDQALNFGEDGPRLVLACDQALRTIAAILARLPEILAARDESSGGRARA